MAEPPPTLTNLLAASQPEAAARAWEAFLAEYHRLLLSVARTLGGDSDAVMDRFAYAVEQLRRDDYRRLRAFAPAGAAKFTTWLVVAVRRLCVDHERRRFGRRSGSHDAEQGEVRRLRRRIAEAEGGTSDVAALVDDEAAPTDDALLRNERSDQLALAIADLAPGDQLLLRLRFDDGLTAAEIARLMRLPTQFHVYRRLNALLPRLRERLREAGIEGLEP